MDTSSALRALAALAQNHRLAIFRLLVKAGPNGMAAGEIARLAGISAASLTFHMRELEYAGLTRSWRSGRFIRSCLEVESMRGLVTFLTDDCCDGRADLCGGDLIAARSACASSANQPCCKVEEGEER